MRTRWPGSRFLKTAAVGAALLVIVAVAVFAASCSATDETASMTGRPPATSSGATTTAPAGISAAGPVTNPSATGSSTTTVSAASLGSTTRVSEPFRGTGTTVAGRCIQGTVMGTDDKPVPGATVSVVIDAADPLYEASGGRLVGTATADSSGAFQVPTSTLPLGSIVDVTVVKTGYASVFVYGTYGKAVVEVDFKDLGSQGGDRRMPVGDQMPPLPLEGLLPGGSGV